MSLQVLIRKLVSTGLVGLLCLPVCEAVASASPTEEEVRDLVHRIFEFDCSTFLYRTDDGQLHICCGHKGRKLYSDIKAQGDAIVPPVEEIAYKVIDGKGKVRLSDLDEVLCVLFRLLDTDASHEAAARIIVRIDKKVDEILASPKAPASCRYGAYLLTTREDFVWVLTGIERAVSRIRVQNDELVTRIVERLRKLDTVPVITESERQEYWRTYDDLERRMESGEIKAIPKFAAHAKRGFRYDPPLEPDGNERSWLVKAFGKYLLRCYSGDREVISRLKDVLNDTSSPMHHDERLRALIQRMSTETSQE